MPFFRELPHIIREVEAADPNPIVLPITRTGRRAEGGYYVCGGNGRGCGKTFTDIASKNAHLFWCQRKQTSGGA